MNIHNVNAVAAISGGADSACMAYLLKKQGYHVGGIYLRMFDSNEADQALQDAVKIADLLAIPFEVIDVRGKFDKEIVQPFTCDYLSGLTPNPCLRCNPLIKWNQMVVHLDLKPHQYIATRHYAIIDRSTGKFPTLRRSPFKDQSYFLSRLTRKNIKRTLLPI